MFCAAKYNRQVDSFSLRPPIRSVSVTVGNVAKAGDLNADGLADLVIGGYSITDNGYQVMVFKNATSGSNLSFSKTNSFESAVYINALHLADYDADNDLDIHMKVYDQNLCA